MVERLFETPTVKCEGSIYTDISSDKEAFVEQIYKNKREDEDETLAVSADVARYIQLADSKSKVHGGGHFSTEENVKTLPHTLKNFPGVEKLLATKISGGDLRRISILAAVNINRSEPAGTLSSIKNSDKFSTDNSSIGINKNNTGNAHVPLMQSVPSTQQVLNGKSAVGQKKSALETTTVNVAMTTNTHLPFAELQTQRTEIAKGCETQSSLMNAMLQKTMQNAAAVTDSNHGASSRSFNIDYQFQRWAGDHSVKISIPTEARRDANIMLLPSDARAADVLSKQMVHLSGHTPELLKPEHDNEEQKRHQQQDAQDEEQE